MKALKAVPALFGVHPGEGRMVLLTLAVFFCAGMGRAFTRTAAYTFFLVEFDGSSIPYIYIGTSVTMTLVMYGYLKLGERLPLSKRLIINFGFMLVVQVAFLVGFMLSRSRWLALALPIWYEGLCVLLALAIWSLAGNLFTVRQGKRLFGLVGSGVPLAFIVGGFVTPLLVRLIGTTNLLLVATGGIGLALLLVLAIGRLFRERVDAATAPANVHQPPASTGGLLRNRYVISIFTLFAFWTLAFFFVDNIFYERVGVRFPAEHELATFMGYYSALMGILTLLSGAFLTGPFLSRYGLRAGTLALPVALAISIAPLALAGSAWGLIAFLFWPAFIAKLLNYAVDTIDRSARSILYQPLPATMRGQVQTATEGVLQPIMIGVAGVVLLLLHKALSFTVVQIAYVLLAILAGWVPVALVVGRAYPTMLMQALVRRRLGDSDVSLDDGSSIAVLQQALQSPHEDVVIYALNTLEEQQDATLPATLQPLLAHPAPAVRADVLARIERLELRTALPAVRRRLDGESSPQVQGALLRTLAALGDTDELEIVSAYLAASDPAIRLSATVALLRHGGIGGVLTAGQQLLQWIAAPDPRERVFGAQVLGEVGVGHFYQPLLALLQDADPHVQRAALRAAGRLLNPRLWPVVVDNLESPLVQKAAMAALVAGDESALPAIEVALTQPGQKREVLLRLAQVCGRVRSQALCARLQDRIAYPDSTVRSEMLRALQRCGYQATGDQVASIHAQIMAEARDAAWILATMRDMGEDAALALLQGALQAELGQQRARIFDLLSFLTAPQSVRRAQQTLDMARASIEQRAYALEILDVVTPQEVKGILVPLVEDLPLDQRLQRLGTMFPQPALDRTARLRALVTDAEGRFSTWTSACALDAIGRLSITGLSVLVSEAAIAPEPLIRETACWTAARLDGKAPLIPAEPSPHAADLFVSRAAGNGDSTVTTEKVMLSTIEKVIILKTARMFDQIPDHTLAAVASILEVVEVTAGTTIFAKGDLGNAMYIIVAGEVRVHDGDHTFDHLGARDVFGEMALLDAEPRSASVTAVADTLLLRLDQDAFYDLMEDHSAIARSIIQVLSRRLRERMQDLNDLQARYDELEQSRTGLA